MDIISKSEEREGTTFLKFLPNGGYEYPLVLPVILKGSREGTGKWTWNGSTEKPTLRPSVETTHGESGKITHFWLTDGVCIHLDDSTDGIAGQTLPLIPFA